MADPEFHKEAEAQQADLAQKQTEWSQVVE